MSDITRAIELIKDNRKAEARQILIDILKTDRQNEQAWLYLAACATSRIEYEKSIQQVLLINPTNAQALRQAQKNNIEILGSGIRSLEDPGGRKNQKGKKLSREAKQLAKKEAQAAKKKGQPAEKAERSGGSRTRTLLLLLILILVGGGAAFVLLSGGDSGTEEVANTTLTPEAETTPAETADASAGEASEETPEAETTATSEPTEETTPTEEATSQATSEATAEATPEPTQEASPTEALPVLGNPVEYVEGVRVLSGEGDNPDELETLSTYPSDARLNVVIDLGGRGDDLLVEVRVSPENGAETIENALEVEEGEAQSLVIPLETPENGWESGFWQVRIQVNGVEATSTRFAIEAAEAEAVAAQPSPTPEGDSGVAQAVTPTPEAESAPQETATEEATDGTARPASDFPTLSLVYNPDRVYVVNNSSENQDISGLVFRQTLSDGTVLQQEATLWQQGGSAGPGTIFALQPQSCFQIGVSSGIASTRPVDCVRLSNWQTRSVNLFWRVIEDATTTFEVFWELEGEDPILLAECDIEASSCDFDLPPREEQ